MGGSHSNSTDQDGISRVGKGSGRKNGEEAIGDRKGATKKRTRVPPRGIVNNVISAMAGKSSRAVPSTLQQSPAYPYPRPHSAYVLLPDGGISIPQRQIPCFAGVRRPPLNRSIPPIPESRSDDSLRTASSCRSGQPSAAGTPTEPPSTSKTSSNTQALVIANHSASFDSPAIAKKSDRVPPSPSMSQKSQLRSPLLATASRIRSKITSSFGPKKVKSQEGSSDSSQGSTQSLEKKNSSLPSRVFFRHSHSNYQTKINNFFNKDKQEPSGSNSGVPRMCKAQSLELGGPNPSSGDSSKKPIPQPNRASYFPKPKSGYFLGKGQTKKSSSATPKPSQAAKVTNPLGVQSVMKKSPSLPVRKPRDAPQAVQFRPPQRPNLLRVEASRTKRVPVGCAPLAESEPSTVENSPAVEFAPSGMEFSLAGGRPGWNQPPWIKRTHPRSPLAEEPPKKVQGGNLKGSLSMEAAIPGTALYSRSRAFASESANASETIRSDGGEGKIEDFEGNQWNFPGRNSPCCGYDAPRADVQTGCSRAMVTETNCGSACTVCEGRPRGEDLYEIGVGKWNRVNSPQLLSRVDEFSEPLNESVDEGNPSPLGMSSFLASPSPSDRSVSSASAPHSASYSSQASIRLRSPLVDFAIKSSADGTPSNDATLNDSPKSQTRKPRRNSQFLTSNISPIKNDPLHDSGVRVSGGESSQCSGSSAGGNADSKVASPVSDHKGLIDDEIRDQPLLTLASPSRSTTEDEWERGSIRSSDRVGPLRHSFRSSGMRRSMMRDSIISTTSLDSEDCMLDFDNSIDLGMSEEGGDECGDSVSVFMSGSLSRKFSESLRSAKSSPSRRNSYIQNNVPAGPISASPGHDRLKKRDSINLALEELTSVMNSFGLSESCQTERMKEVVPPEKNSGNQGGAKGVTVPVADPAHRPPPGPSGPPPSNTSSSSVAQQRRAQYGSRSITTASSSTGSAGGNGPLRPPPVPSSPSPSPMLLDPHVYRAMVQDITVLKTLLFRLKGELQKDNECLKEELLLLKQQLAERDSQIELLRRQIDKTRNYGKSNGAPATPKMEVDT